MRVLVVFGSLGRSDLQKHMLSFAISVHFHFLGGLFILEIHMLDWYFNVGALWGASPHKKHTCVYYIYAFGSSAVQST